MASKMAQAVQWFDISLFAVSKWVFDMAKRDLVVSKMVFDVTRRILSLLATSKLDLGVQHEEEG